VLTPLPGADLYDQVQEGLLTRDTGYYDFIHTILLTALPLRETHGRLKSRLMGLRPGVPLRGRGAGRRRPTLRRLAPWRTRGALR
jgi:hypothetical protein